MILDTPDILNADDAHIRAACRGVFPLSGRLERWQRDICRDAPRLAEWLDHYGSPLNLLDPSPMAGNAAELTAAANRAGVDLKIFFARKANKALTFVDQAVALGLGVDVASERELLQALDRGTPPRDLIVTAAIKPLALLELCVQSGATVAIDNEDELELLIAAARRADKTIPVAMRLAPAAPSHRRPTRFGLTGTEIVELVHRHLPAGARSPLALAGIHFHLHGYHPADRTSALAESMRLIDTLRHDGHRPTFVDIGGGIPMSYLPDGGEWEAFWQEHRAALRGERDTLTYDGHGLGLVAHASEILGQPNVYPYHQALVRGPWLDTVLGAPVSRDLHAGTAAEAMRARGLELRCEPGRSLLDGCGLTAARVQFRKRRTDGTWLIGVAMNRTQCRSTSEDYLVDPLLVRPATPTTLSDARPTGPIEGYLVGAYCIEQELLTWRRLRFPAGVRVGDIIVFPNTAGYLMHILESASHQIPLALNLAVNRPESPVVDPIDHAPT